MSANFIFSANCFLPIASKASKFALFHLSVFFLNGIACAGMDIPVPPSDLKAPPYQKRKSSDIILVLNFLNYA